MVKGLRNVLLKTRMSRLRAHQPPTPKPSFPPLLNTKNLTSCRGYIGQAKKKTLTRHRSGGRKKKTPKKKTNNTKLKIVREREPWIWRWRRKRERCGSWWSHRRWRKGRRHRSKREEWQGCISWNQHPSSAKRHRRTSTLLTSNAAALSPTEAEPQLSAETSAKKKTTPLVTASTAPAAEPQPCRRSSPLSSTRPSPSCLLYKKPKTLSQRENTREIDCFRQRKRERGVAVERERERE